jgi:cytosine/uracil/thiamine/allantoin permease
MLRSFIGFAIGVVLIIGGIGAGGMGHGTYAPLIFTAPYVVLLPDSLGVIAIVAGPLLWAVYFQFIPKIKHPSARLLTLVAVIATHLSAGTFVAVNDPDFARAWEHERSTLIGFAVLVALAMSILFFFSLRERRSLV